MVEKKVPENIHLWCHAHVLNLVMSDTTKNAFVCWANELFSSRELDYCIPMSFLHSRSSKKKTMAGKKLLTTQCKMQNLDIV